MRCIDYQRGKTSIFGRTSLSYPGWNHVTGEGQGLETHLGGALILPVTLTPSQQAWSSFCCHCFGDKTGDRIQGEAESGHGCFNLLQRVCVATWIFRRPGLSLSLCRCWFSGAPEPSHLGPSPALALWWWWVVGGSVVQRLCPRLLCASEKTTACLFSEASVDRLHCNVL